jgi:hypothetical protein
VRQHRAGDRRRGDEHDERASVDHREFALAGLRNRELRTLLYP